MVEERFKEIPNTNGKYIASNFGYVLATRYNPPKKLKHIKTKSGNYKIVYNNRAILLNKIIAELFLEDYDPKSKILYKDGNPANNAVDNFYQEKPQKVYHVNSKKVFESERAAAKKFFVSIKTIKQACETAQPVRGNYFEYYISFEDIAKEIENQKKLKI